MSKAIFKKRMVQNVNENRVEIDKFVQRMDGLKYQKEKEKEKSENSSKKKR